LDKKNYSVFKNIIFTHKYILQDYKIKYWPGAVIIVLSNIFTTFMFTLLPAYVVRLLIEESSVLQILLKLTCYCLILYSTTILYKRLERSLDNNVNKRRMFKCLDYYDNIMVTSYQNIDTSTGREIINAGLDSYMDDFHQGFTHMILDFRILIQGIFGLIVYCVFIAKINVLVSLILIVISSISVIVNIYNKKWINKNKEKWFKIDTKLEYLSLQSTSLNNAKNVRLYSIKNWFMDTFEYLTGLRQKWLEKELRIYYLVNIIERILTAVKYAIAYFVMFNKVKSGLDISQFIMVIGLILGVNNWITSIFDSIKYLELNNVTVNNSRTALEMDDAKSAKISSNDSGNSYNQIPTEKTHELRFENVSFAFPESKTKTFDKFNLTIQRGEKLALVGVNGAGKTTLVKLMCGLYKPTEGKIYLDDVDISTYKREDYFKVFSTVFQDFQVLALSIAENISCCTPEKTDYNRVNKCIELSGLKDRVGELTKVANTNMLKELDNDGVVFSGGQTQKLMIARCLYKDSPIIVLDEPTSALDALAESKLYEKYSSLINDKTSVFISHRLSSTKFCHRIIMLNEGKIIEEGTHDELLKKKGEYAKMFNIQSSYYQEGA
jgi:ATP-binding cassette subfamily B protein